MEKNVILPVVISFVISALLGPVIIPFLRRLKVGQTEREELKSHLKKTGTPTMGGLMILISIVVTSLFYVKDYPRIIPILFLTLGFGIIGFLDDYLKVVLKRSDGLLAWQKMIAQIIVTGIFAYYVINYTDISLKMLIPFSNGLYNISYLFKTLYKSTYITYFFSNILIKLFFTVKKKRNNMFLIFRFF